MAPTPILIRGKRKRAVSSKTSSPVLPAPPPTRRRVRPRSTPFGSRLPFEILEHIFLLSENVNLARASPLLGFRLSSRGTLVELVAAAFGPTWEHSVRQTADDTSNPAFQSTILACPWAKMALILDAQQLWLRRHSAVKCHHALAKNKSWARLMAAAQNSPRPEALLPGPWPATADSDGPATAASWTRDIHSCFALEQAVFMYRTCPELSRWRPASAYEGSIDALLSTAEAQSAALRQLSSYGSRANVHPSAQIPEHLLLAGGPYEGAGHDGAASVRRRLRDVVDELFWLVKGGARLQSTDGWEVTQLGVRYLMQIDVTAQEDGSDGAGVGAGTFGYSTDALVAAVVILFKGLGVFSWQWPMLLLEEACRGVLARAAYDSGFRLSMTCASLQRALNSEWPYDR